MTTPTKVDLFKLHAAEYAAPRKPVFVDTRPALYLRVAGEGAPGGDTYTRKIGALYGVAFTVKMRRKSAGLSDYALGKLECQWDFPPGACPSALPPERWRWKLLIRTLDGVSEAEVAQAIAALLDKGKAPESAEVGLETLAEGRCVQMLHVGPYDQEGESLKLMEDFAAKKGYRPTGAPHEIYLSDPRRVAPERLKTLLRRPVAPLSP